MKKATYFTKKTGIMKARVAIQFWIEPDMLERAITHMLELQETITADTVEKKIRFLLYDQGMLWFDMIFADTYQEPTEQARQLARKLFPTYFAPAPGFTTNPNA